jgi:hypothetical protein
MRTKFVVDPSGSDCYGKYFRENIPPKIPESEIVEVDDLSNYDVVEWRYSDTE